MSRTATAEIWNELRAAEAEIERLRAALGKKYREGYDNALAEQHVEIERLRAEGQRILHAKNHFFDECTELRAEIEWLRAEKDDILKTCAWLLDRNEG